MSEYSEFLLTAAAKPFPLYFTLVYAVGLVAAIVIGLIAFFNSKRPVGWENAKKPDLIPDLTKKETTNSEEDA